MIRKHLKLVLILICMFGISVIAGLALNGRPARASSKKVYKSEVVGMGLIESTLDQRAAEGWQVVTVSAYATVNGDQALLVFEKQ